MTKIGVGLIGYEPGRSWAALAHVPALRALDGYAIAAVATTRPASAAAAARDIGLPMDAAFTDAAALARDPRVDLVVVTVKVPHHRELIAAALAAGKHVFCEWPLGNGLAEAEAIAADARKAGVAHMVGLQACMAPAVQQVRAMIAEGYVGEVLSTTLIGSGMQWGGAVDRPNAYIVDRANGATLLTIPFGHTVDALCFALGEFRSLSATLAIRQPEVRRVDTGEMLTKTAADQIVVGGTLESGAVAAIHYRGGIARGTRLSWEINGTHGDLQITAEGGHGQIFDLSLAGAQGEARRLEPIAIAAPHRWVPGSLSGPSVNVAQLYARFAEHLRGAPRAYPDFDDAVRRHRLIDAIERSAAEARTVAL
ncbi:Gfo/Idh/MocA family protein [Flavisphingomonas formosensis]|uniref:Gfo/Idh/MocA family protein n=1 Tax=Flavisphingomonas formosensis TaxID=861534 RepID=UPI0012F71C7C|nr:Gfo/Idh/MocA family oxidoreductase [Sphingomonas formosensis]